jgi:hypothetical protein
MVRSLQQSYLPPINSTGLQNSTAQPLQIYRLPHASSIHPSLVKLLKITAAVLSRCKHTSLIYLFTISSVFAISLLVIDPHVVSSLLAFCKCILIAFP